MLFDLGTEYALLLLLCLAFACAFEFVNGFHDTANAVATVIYTNTLKPIYAVVWSALFNALGVLAGGITVAMGIVNLLPVESLIDQNIHHALAMVFALLTTAIVWNVGTWYLGLPASSSHTLIGSILGVGLAFSFLPGSQGAAVNWSKAGEIGLSLLLSPMIGFGLTVILMLLVKRFIPDPKLFAEPVPGKVPPTWIRVVLMATCTGVSYSHGANDGQKGVGLVMLILIGIVPAHFALDRSQGVDAMRTATVSAQRSLADVDTMRLGVREREYYRQAATALSDLDERLTPDAQGRALLAERDNFEVRRDILLTARSLGSLSGSEDANLPAQTRAQMRAAVKDLRRYTDYAPNWVIVMISLSLGFGTMVGWRRIVRTIGEKIGKQHLTYAQGAASEFVAASTIGLSTSLGLPVSTTQVLSSGIAGSMFASGGLGNLQFGTVRSILLAWVLTFPVTLIMSGGLYLLFRAIF